MTTLTFTVAFHGPFHVARGSAESGFDRTVDRDFLLPASSVKGVMRAEAVGVLGLPGSMVADVFGAPGCHSPWAWSDATIHDSHVGRVARIRVRPGLGGEVADHHLMLGEHVWADSATFVIDQTASLSAEEEDRHVLVLRACAHSLTSLGGARNRGEGWVTITDGHPLTRNEIMALDELRVAAS